MNFLLTDKPIDGSVLMEGLRDARAGGFVSFEGRVRSQNEGRSVQTLEYEAYAPVAEKEGESIISEARSKFGILGALCVHRTGTLALGDIAVWVGVAAAHRGPAFEACRYIIDETKSRVPIWKKEHYGDGTAQWINCAARTTPGDRGPA